MACIWEPPGTSGAHYLAGDLEQIDMANPLFHQRLQTAYRNVLSSRADRVPSDDSWMHAPGFINTVLATDPAAERIGK